MERDVASMSRFAFLILAVVNAVLNLLGYQTISEQFVNDVVAILSGVYFIWAGWKNNYLSKKGIKQKEVLKKHKLH
ncbi:phage holin [Halalkalibacter krulwichiae]|uniref:Phage lysis protein, holin n=1 Tax=Halalkalibacter krulwichiae TaxID=199441 RepID=A0A1X9MBY5_9BACI|nr:phage holin [Halalkalibacter krulwichiae]ARK30908.1 Phage lysis protein, holin [Halalkalibacter krulwichiae]